jgi:hypothetical protein
MAYVLRFVQRFRPGDEKKFLTLEARFAALERRFKDLPQGRRLKPYAGREPGNTLIWECTFTTLQDVQAALARLASHPGHEKLLRAQSPLFLEAWTEIYEVLELEATHGR